MVLQAEVAQPPGLSDPQLLRITELPIMQTVEGGPKLDFVWGISFITFTGIKFCRAGSECGGRCFLTTNIHLFSLCRHSETFIIVVNVVVLLSSCGDMRFCLVNDAGVAEAILLPDILQILSGAFSYETKERKSHCRGRFIDLLILTQSREPLTNSIFL